MITFWLRAKEEYKGTLAVEVKRGKMPLAYKYPALLGFNATASPHFYWLRAIKYFKYTITYGIGVTHNCTAGQAKMMGLTKGV